MPIFKGLGMKNPGRGGSPRVLGETRDRLNPYWPEGGFGPNLASGMSDRFEVARLGMPNNPTSRPLDNAIHEPFPFLFMRGRAIAFPPTMEYPNGTTEAIFVLLNIEPPATRRGTVPWGNFF